MNKARSELFEGESADAPQPGPVPRRLSRRNFVRSAIATAFAIPVVSVLEQSDVVADEKKEDSSPAEDSPEFLRMTEAAKEHFAKSLQENRKRAEIFQEMLPTILEFARIAGVRVVVCKCMDGRVHTNDHKGLPPTFATNKRSQGNEIDVDFGNKDFWDTIGGAAIEAESEGIPLLIITSAHRGEHGSSCAAFKRKWDSKPADGDKRASDNVVEQAHRLRHAVKIASSIKNSDDVEILSAMTNTDTGAMTFSKQEEKDDKRTDTQLFDAEAIMAAEKLREPSDVFEPAFMYKPIEQEWAHESIRGKTPLSLLDGSDAALFWDMEVKIAWEAYLIRLVKEGGENPGASIIRHDILDRFRENLGIAHSRLRHVLIHMMASNLAHATHYRNLNLRLTPEELHARTSHGELEMAYSLTGHDLAKPNSIILVKPGAGNDVKSVQVGRDVLLQNLKDLKLSDKLPPMVHINIELEKPIETWEEYRHVRERICAKLDLIQQEFPGTVRVLTTYSYSHIVLNEGKNGIARTKQFFPLNVKPDNKHIVVTDTQDMGRGMTSRKNFNTEELRKREGLYTKTGIAIAELQESPQ